ncbi:cache domain-containing protein [soil metagenome]
MRLKLKIIALAVVPLIAALLLIAFAVRHQERSLAQQERALVEAEYMNARRAELRHYVELAVSTIRPLYESGGNDAQAQAEAIRLLASLDYGSDGYFFVYDLQGKVLMHSRQPELLGQNLWNLRDVNGQPTIQQLIARAKAGGGYVDYLWRKPSTQQSAPKLGYVVALERWNWMVGTGLYLDDIHATMGQLDQQARANIAATLLWIAGIAVGMLALISAGGLLLNLSEQRVADGKLRTLARRVVQSQEEERAHLARELHDGTSQTLVAAKLLVESAVEDLERGVATQPARGLASAVGHIDASLNEVRRISHRLRPALLDTLGLPAALQHLGSELDDGRTAYEVQISGTETALPDEAKTVLFRVAQEALANIGKHARAARVQIALAFGADGGVALQINDDGRGFEVGPPLPTQGIGLRNMRERVAAIGGQFEIQSSPGHGTQLTADVSRDALARLHTA